MTYSLSHDANKEDTRSGTEGITGLDLDELHIWYSELANERVAQVLPLEEFWERFRSRFPGTNLATQVGGQDIIQYVIVVLRPHDRTLAKGIKDGLFETGGLIAVLEAFLHTQTGMCCPCCGKLYQAVEPGSVAPSPSVLGVGEMAPPSDAIPV